MRALALSGPRVREVLDFLLEAGLAETDGTRVIGRPARIHIPPRSPLVAQHHRNWRTRSIMALDQADESALHYSGIFSISADAARQIRDLIASAITATEPVIRDAEDQQVHVICADVFRLA